MRVRYTDCTAPHRTALHYLAVHCIALHLIVLHHTALHFTALLHYVISKCSGGALGSLTLGLFVKELWARGKPGMFAIPESNHEYTRNVRSLPGQCGSLVVFILCLAQKLVEC